MTNISIGKYYPDIVTQFVFGIVCYSVVLFILKDFISVKVYDEYKYYVGIAIIVDTTFLLYQYKYNSIRTIADNNNTSDKIVTPPIAIPPGLARAEPPKIGATNPDATKEPIDKNKSPLNKSAISTELDVSFGSDFDDYKVAHDLSPENDADHTRLPVSESEPNSEADPKSKSRYQSKLVGFDNKSRADNKSRSDAQSISFSIQ